MIENDDEFWKVALEADPAVAKERLMGEDDADFDDGLHDGGKIIAYRLPTTDIVLNLESLAATDGIWSPLGADAWYASALLASMLLTNECSIWQTRNDLGDFVVLELGSGAVGLSGLACAVALGRRKEGKARCKVILTDNDLPVLEKLRSNVSRNEEAVLSISDQTMEISVQHLDWNDGCDESLIAAVDLVLGSELVYTEETAIACCNLLESLLNTKCGMDIWIVQVTDRYGWLDIVVPRLESVKGVSILPVPISADAHKLASSMMPMGGAMDRYAYGAFCISNKGA